MSEIKLDDLDKKIMEALLKDARTPFQEIAKQLVVSGGTIHVRYNKLKEMGVISGSKIEIDYSKMGLDTVAFIGINLASAKDYAKTLERLNNFSEVTEIHYTTGQYSMFVKVVTKSMRDFHLFLTEKLQSIDEIRSTETLMSLDSPVNREPEIPANS